MINNLAKGIKLLIEGKPIFIYDFDNRENEIDFVIYAKYITPEWIKWMRIYAGGLICFVTDYEVGKILEIDLQTNYLKKLGYNKLIKNPCYGDEPAFSIYVNHINVKTGIRDVDRAYTIKRLYDVIKFIHQGDVSKGKEIFYNEFYTPGHVPILLGRIGKRFGHTELSLILAKIANIVPALVIVEMLGESNEALNIKNVKEIAEKLNTIIIKGEEIVQYYEKYLKHQINNNFLIV